MTIKHIQDQIESYGLRVAREAFLRGIDHSINVMQKKEVSKDDTHDMLEEIVKDKLNSIK